MSSLGFVRIAAPDDLPRLVQIDHMAAAGDGERGKVLAAAVNDGNCLVMATDAQVVGYVISTPTSFFGRDFVSLLMVDSNHRRTGVGQVLLRAAVSHATTARVFTSTNQSNGPMRSLLEAERWSYSGTLDGLDEGDPELVYFIDAQSAPPVGR